MANASWRLLHVAALIAVVLSGCTGADLRRTPVECPQLPDERQTLPEAWQAVRPDQPMPFSIPVRRRLFVLQVLLISAGMYDEPPSDPMTVYTQYATQFVQDFGMSRNPGLKDAFAKLTSTLQDVRQRSENDLSDNCGLILARRTLRTDPESVSADWVLQTITWGFAPTYQEYIQRLVKQYAQTCSTQADVANVPESVLACTAGKVGL